MPAIDSRSRLSARVIATVASVLVLSVTVVPQAVKTPSLEETIAWCRRMVRDRREGFRSPVSR
jgi:hypothetical protein